MEAYGCGRGYVHPVINEDEYFTCEECGERLMVIDRSPDCAIVQMVVPTKEPAGGGHYRIVDRKKNVLLTVCKKCYKKLNQ